VRETAPSSSSCARSSAFHHPRVWRVSSKRRRGWAARTAVHERLTAPLLRCSSHRATAALFFFLRRWTAVGRTRGRCAQAEPAAAVAARIGTTRRPKRRRSRGSDSRRGDTAPWAQRQPPLTHSTRCASSLYAFACRRLGLRVRGVVIAASSWFRARETDASGGPRA
jgi:hypothetical protein